MMNYKEAKVIVQTAGLIDENDGHPDIDYVKIAQLLAEVQDLGQILDDYRRFYEWIGDVDYGFIAEWDEMESEEE
tara:strand:- start:167 stop:391 length:225 start_codon:yes stop_codon:yes gene_type:complete